MTEDHLGGHAGVTHIDKGALEWLQKEYGVESMLDVGCGPGGMVDTAGQLGIKAFGIDGDRDLVTKWSKISINKFMLHDFTLGPAPWSYLYDLCWSVEFVEHVEEQYMANWIETMKLGQYVVITFAPPGWPGHHHVNCQPESYWIKQFGKYGLWHDGFATNQLRWHSTMNKGVPPSKWGGKEYSRTFVKDRGLFFVNMEWTGK